MKVFISYHRADTKYRKKLETILNENNINYYAVPLDTCFDEMHNQQIKDSILTKMEDCDVLICLVGKETYTRGHVDWEIHKALKGGIYNRKGIVALLLENRGDSIYNLDWSTFPNRLQDNMGYIILEQFASFYSRIDDYLYVAF